ncbi:hypothetical protein PARPLA_02024 [Rhodobacteraceae bacterium THAF1]|nr:hypothetical protein FIU81_03515 [Palleronia sp. THAF1]VDC25554.1 hypothetical protein PARPLA_02024 [Rhodobacteraceae bacterium THAF1]
MKCFRLCLALLLFVPQVHAYSGDGYRVCRLDPNGDNFLALRAGPGTGYQMIMQLPPETVVESRGSATNGKWLPVVVEYTPQQTYLRNLPNGYVWGDYLCRL